MAARDLAELASKPAYEQFRSVGVDGLELVRVDRSGPERTVRVVRGADLQSKADQRFFKEAIVISPNDVHVSSIELNRERGAIETPHVPTLRVASLIPAPDGKPFGVVIINIDMRPIFDRLRSLTRVGGRLFLVDERGDYLLHPDAGKAFAFEFGRSARWQDDLPDLAKAVGSNRESVQFIHDATGERNAAALISVRPADGPSVGVLELVPDSVIMAPLASLREAAFTAGAAAVLCAAFLAIILARSLSRPLVEMTRAVEGFTGEGTIAVPIRSSGEIGVLARAFSRMATEVQEKAAALNREISQRHRIFDTSLDLILVVSRTGTFIQVSPSSIAILGRKPEEMIGRSAVDFINPEDLERTRAEMRAARRGQHMRNFDCRYVHANGRDVLLQWTGVWSEPEQQHYFIGRDTTERSLAEEKFHLAVEASPSGMVMIDAAGVIVLVNAEAERLFGYSRAELIGKSVDMLVPSIVRSRHSRHRAGFVAEPAARRMGIGRDLHGLRKDGSEFPVEIGLNPIQTRQGLLILSVVVDITERKAAEAALRRYAEREQLFIAAVESSQDAIITKSLDGVITGWNHAAERLFGYDAQEAIGKSIDLIVPDDRRDEVRGVLDRVGRGEPIAHFETVRVNNAGRRIDVSLSVSPVKSTSGTIIGAAKVVRDITGTKLAQVAFEQETGERRKLFEILSNTISSMVDAVLVADVDGHILHSNPAAARLIGLGPSITPIAEPEPDAVLQADGVTLIPRDQRPLRRAIRGEQISNVDIVIKRKEQSKTYRLVANGGPIRDSANRIAGAVVVFRDVTDSMETERQLRQSQKMEAVGELTGGVAHDFNNILTVITGTIEILQEAVADQPEMAAVAKMIDDAASRGADLTQRLLAFARRQPLQPRETDINALVVETAKLLRPTLGEQIEIESMLSDQLPTALVDPSQLSAALINLALNSRDAMPRGGKLFVETGPAHLDEVYAKANAEVQPGRYVMLAVSDTGSGIPAAIQDKVFEPFFTTKDVGRGTGLGLSMVYGFVKQSGGHIKIYSEEGHGTTIKIYLPPAEAQHPLLDAAPVVPVEGGSEIVLAVEDDPLVRTYVVTQLRSLGYQVLTAANAAEALVIVESGAHIDVLFTDVIMPGMNGRQLAEAAKKRRPELRVLFTSGYTENAIVHHGRLDPGVLLLAKPYRKADLARMMRQAVGEKERHG
jgi:PAS domain S-box-containing protein